MSSAYTFKTEEEAWAFVKRMFARGEDFTMYHHPSGKIQVSIIYYSPGYKKTAE